MKSGDYFSATAQAYAAYRPSYPDDLIGYLAARRSRTAEAEAH